MDKGALVICKETQILLTLLGILVVVAAMFVLFGWGKVHQSPPAEVETEIQAPTAPEVEAQQGVQAVTPPPAAGQPQPAALGFPQGTSIGVQVIPVDPWTKDFLRLRNTDGAVVSSIKWGGLGDQAGLQRHDVVYGIGNDAVESVADFTRAVGAFRPGNEYTFKIYRDGKKERVKLKYTAAAATQAAAAVTKNTVTWIGADVQDIDPLLQQYFGLPNTNGAIVSFVEPKTPAAAAGLRQGDVIQKLDTKAVEDIRDVQKFIRAKDPGDKVQLTLWRGGQVITPFVILTDKPVTVEQKPAFLPAPEVEAEAAWIGLTLEPMTRAEARELRLPAGQSGMVISAVTKDTPGAKAGLRIGDIILGVNGQEVTGLQTFQTAAESAEGAVLDVLRSEKHIYVTIPAPKPAPQGGGSLAQVALPNAAPRTLAIGSYGTNLFAQVYPSFEKAPYILIYNPGTAALEAIPNPDLANPSVPCRLAIDRGAGAVLAGNISANCQLLLAAENVAIYPGVFGQLYTAVRMYKSGALMASSVDVMNQMP